MKIRTVIIDDEPRARKMMRSLISEFFEEVNIVGEASSAEEGRMVIKKTSPDLILLDVEMPKGDGFSLIDSFEDLDFEVVFTTAYNDYAITAIKHSALDYLLKPVSIDDLKAMFDRYKEKRNKFRNKSAEAFFIPEISGGGKQSQKIALPTTKGFKIIKLNDIIHGEASRVYSSFFLVDGKEICVSRSLKYFEGLLKEYGFMRVHGSSIINLDHIDEYFRGTQGKAGHVLMSNGQEVSVSRNKRVDLLEKFSLGQG